MRLLILLAASAAILDAGNPWNKDSSQWSGDEVQRILTNSPWARVVGATFDTPADDEKGFELPPGNQSGDSRGATDGKWDGGVSKNSGGTLPTLPVTVRWDSALYMMKAWQRASELSAPGLTEEELQKYYVITVIGLVPGKNSKRLTRPAGAGADAATPNHQEQMLQEQTLQEQMLTGIKSQSHLFFRNKPSVRPDEVTLDATTGALHFCFPKSSPVAMDDKEVLFSTHYGRLTVRLRFRLKDMLYKNELEL